MSVKQTGVLADVSAVDRSALPGHAAGARRSTCLLLALWLATAPAALAQEQVKTPPGRTARAAEKKTPGLSPPAIPPMPSLEEMMRLPKVKPGDISEPNPELLKGISPPPLPPEPAVNHSRARAITIGPLHMGPLLQIATLRPIRLEASFNEPISLRQALTYALDHNLPIKISAETWNSQLFLYKAALGGFLPNVSLSYGLTHTHIFPRTESNSRTFNTTVSYSPFQGGQVLYSALAQFYRARGWAYSYRGTINDQLLNVYSAYMNALLNRALLQIRIKSVETSEAQLRLNEQLYTAGTGTRFAVMQSRTQLALDRQALLLQQVAVRQSSLSLALAMNLPLAINLVPEEDEVSEAQLVDESTQVDALLSVALVHRPELRQYEMFKLSSARNIQVQAAAIYPTVTTFVSYNNSSTTVHSSPSPAQTAAAAASTTRSTTTTTSSGTAGGTAPGSGSAAAAGASSAGASPLATAGAGVFGGKFRTAAWGMQMAWNLPGLGYSIYENVQAARALARQTLMQANQQLMLVNEQVRSSYLNALTARVQIDVAASGVASSAEALRLANLRVQTGVGTNLELIQAQRDYITALVNQAQAIINSNLAQAQLLHDTGMISVETLTAGYNPRTGARPGAGPY